MRRAAAVAALIAAVGAPAAAADCPPFFDDDPRTRWAPPAPALDAFDRAVLSACGPIRGRVTAAEFRALLDDHWADVVDALGWQSRAKADIHTRLARIWLTHDGFDHVFCGEFERGSIGGLHFRARFLQLQREGTLCYAPSPREEIAEGRIYSIGVRTADGRNRHPIKGYALSQSGLELFALASRAADANCLDAEAGWGRYRSGFDRSFHVAVEDAGATVHHRVICKALDFRDPESRGLITIYSDATPDVRIPLCRFADGDELVCAGD